MSVLQLLETGDQILDRLRGARHVNELSSLLTERDRLLAQVNHVPAGLRAILDAQAQTIHTAMASRQRRLTR